MPQIAKPIKFGECIKQESLWPINLQKNQDKGHATSAQWARTQTTHSSNTCRVLNEQWTTTMENVSLYTLRTKHCIIVQKFTPSISLRLAPENIIYSEKKIETKSELQAIYL